jgi:hypothetical protein
MISFVFIALEVLRYNNYPCASCASGLSGGTIGSGTAATAAILQTGSASALGSSDLGSATAICRRAASSTYEDGGAITPRQAADRAIH